MKPVGLMERMKRWLRLVVLGTKRIFISRSVGRLLADKGHFAVYAEDGKRFIVPLHYLEEPIFTELLKMAETKFGFSCNRPIMLPCNGDFMEFVLSQLRYGHKRNPTSETFGEITLL
ncbi:auxin-responsive protein SAUR36-like [Telopea speciosissima]|uniref:auxin-responsive protein SAUR36-like n=1 Tax=Telopea speciosissima TaxID=54955 RepID=UPI001CC78A2A|nr:auxin-responsive protein SAUR36-like [Telopea speciosissima]